jgi:hypothetical protein
MSLATITAKAQLIPRDYGEEFQVRVTGDGTTSRYDLPKSNVELVSVYIEGTPPVVLDAAAFPPGTGKYYLDARQGVITLGTPLPNAKVLVAEGTGSLATIPADIAEFVETAFLLHTRNRVPPADMDALDPMEEYLIATLAVREALWAQLMEAAQEVDVNTPEGMHIPAGQRYQQLLGLIERLELRYRELSAMLGLGMYAIEMFTLRRVSRTTNRLVPIYVPQEFDDHTPPVRVLPPINPGGPVAPPVTP